MCVRAVIDVGVRCLSRRVCAYMRLRVRVVTGQVWPARCTWGCSSGYWKPLYVTRRQWRTPQHACVCVCAWKRNPGCHRETLTMSWIWGARRSYPRLNRAWWLLCVCVCVWVCVCVCVCVRHMAVTLVFMTYGYVCVCVCGNMPLPNSIRLICKINSRDCIQVSASALCAFYRSQHCVCVCVCWCDSPSLSLTVVVRVQNRASCQLRMVIETLKRGAICKKWPSVVLTLQTNRGQRNVGVTAAN